MNLAKNKNNSVYIRTLFTITNTELIQYFLIYLHPEMTSALENSRVDRSSLSNYLSVVSQDLHLEWTLDFTKEIIFGSATHTLKVLVSNTVTVNFDTSNLHIEGATVDGEEAKYFYDGETGALGRKLCVEIPTPLRVEGRIFDVTFRYATDPSASAIQWLDAKGTTGGEQPFVFTQSQAIHARSLFPCMDSPAVKIPYSAEIRAPAWCTVLMSALEVSCAVEENGIKTFKWKQPVPTPAYLGMFVMFMFMFQYAVGIIACTIIVFFF